MTTIIVCLICLYSIITTMITIIIIITKLDRVLSPRQYSYIYICIYVYIYIYIYVVHISQEGIRKRTEPAEPNRTEPFHSKPARIVHFQEPNRIEPIK